MEFQAQQIPSILLDSDKEFWQCNAATLSISGPNDSLAMVLESENYEHNSDAPFVAVRQSAKFLEIETGNLVGKLVVPKSLRKSPALASVEVGSRFGDDFLRFIISDAHGFLQIDRFGSQTANETGWEWLLGYLWGTKLRSCAGRLGIPKAYISRTERTSRPRGLIDPIDWKLPKTPGRWLSTMREHSFNTPAAKLFLAAYDMLIRRENVRSMGFLSDLRQVVHELQMATAPTSLPLRELLKVKSFRNPFYRDYDEVINLSKKIVRGFGAEVSDASDSEAFLFDVSMLFEHFIRNRLKRAGLSLRIKECDLLKIPHGGIFNDGFRCLIPDVVIDTTDGRCLVYDVKYKYWDERYGVNREDLFQLHTYVGRYSCEREVIGCGFVFPIPEKRLNEITVDRTIPDDKGKIGVAIKENRLKMAGLDIPFYVVFLVVPEEAVGEANRNSWAEQFDTNVKSLTTYFAKQCFPYGSHIGTFVNG